MNINLGRIPYLNSEVFYQNFPLDLVNVKDYVPRALSRAARRGEIDVGPVPLVTCFELEDQFMPLRDFCVAVTKQARSVLLFSKRPLEELGDGRIGITGESSTSVQLLKILFNRRFGIYPAEYVSTKELKSDALLLIGDAALNNRHGLPSYLRVYDLAELWHDWTGLPFVFARWIVRRDLNAEALDFLGDLLESSLEYGLQRIDQLAEKRQDLSMTVDEVRDYLRGFIYVLGDKEKESIALFREYFEAQTRQPPVEGTAFREAPNAG